MIFQNFNLLNSKTVFHNIAIPLILQGRDKAFIQRGLRSCWRLST